MKEEFLYLPKVLFTRQPELRAALRGKKGRGEVLIYPFLHGALALVTARDLPDGRYFVKIGPGVRQTLVSSGGMAYMLWFFSCESMETVFGTVAVVQRGEQRLEGVFHIY